MPPPTAGQSPSHFGFLATFGSAPRVEPAASRGGARLSWASWWAVLGVSATFVEAIGRLGARAHHALAGGLDWKEGTSLCILSVLLVYAEGHRSLQLKFVPRVIERALGLSPDSRMTWRALAPLYASSLIGGERRSLMRAWAGVVLIVVAVHIVRRLPEPWRGITDGAVALALTWGLVALVLQFFAAVRKRRCAT